MQRKRELNRNWFIGQFANRRRYTRCAQSDALRRHGKTTRIGELPHSRECSVVIQQGFPHPHQHNIAQGLPLLL